MATTKNNKYELTVLIDELSTDEQVEEMHDKVRELAGRFLRIAPEDGGIKRLAYPIHYHDKARYLFYTLVLAPEEEDRIEAIKSINRGLQYDDNVIRFLLVKA